MPLKITCQVDGFWRGGQKHFRPEKIWPDKTFSEEQLKQLKAEPRLTVTVVKGKDIETNNPPPKPPYTQEQLSTLKWEQLTEMLGDQFKSGMNKEEVTKLLLEMKAETK